MIYSNITEKNKDRDYFLFSIFNIQIYNQFSQQEKNILTEI